MLFVALGFLLLGLVVGGAGLRAAGRMVGRSWRPGAGMLGLACFVGAAVMVVRDAFAPAAGLVLLGVWLVLSVRRTQGPRHSVRREQMDLATAAAILGVEPDASPDAVHAAYRRLIVRTHPDKGGTKGLAAELNAAREAMLRR